MKKLHDLDNGVENIKAKSVDANVISLNGAPIIYENVEDVIHIGYYGKIQTFNADSFEFTTEEYGGFYLNDEGFIIDTSRLVLEGTQLGLAQYTTASRPASSNEGAIIYDSTLKKCILWNGTAWVNLDGTALS